MTGVVHFNSNHGHENFLTVKLDVLDLYIHITNQEPVCVFESIYNESTNLADMAQNVRISMNVISYRDNLVISM